MSSVQLSPPSVDLYNPLPAPPEENPHGVRCSCHSAAYTMRGFWGSSTRSMAPVESFFERIFCHVLPPSFERYTPRVGLGPNTWPMTAT